MELKEKRMIQKWVKALRSGEYSQGRDCLRNDENKYCCLGVLCDLVDNSGWTFYPLSLTTTFTFGDGDEREEFPPHEIMVNLDLYRPEGELALYSYLANLNDSGSTFHEIAKVIEKAYAKELSDLPLEPTPDNSVELPSDCAS